MQKQDLTNPLQRNNLEKQPLPDKPMKQASESVLETRKIVRMKPFGSNKNSNDKPTKAIFNFTSKAPGEELKPVSGKLTLKPTTSSLDFFRNGVQSMPLGGAKPVSGKLDVKSGKGGLSFFTGIGSGSGNQNKEENKKEKQKGVKEIDNTQQKSEENKEKEKPQEIEKKKEETKEEVAPKNESKGLFGNYVKQNNIGSGLFSNLISSSTKKSETNEQKKEEGQRSSLFGTSKPSLSGGLFGSSTKTSSLFGSNTKPTGGLFGSMITKNPNSESSKKVAPIDQSKFNHEDSKPLFEKPVIGGLFDNLKKTTSGGLFSGLASTTNKEGGLFSGNLFSKTNQGDASSFFKKNNIDEVDEDEEGDEEAVQKDDSVDPSKVEMKVTYESQFDTAINLNVRDFKEQPVGGNPPEGGFGNGSVSLETIKPQKDGEQQQNNTITFAYRNPAKLVKHQSILIKGVSSCQILKSRKDAIKMFTYKNDPESGQSIRFLVKILFNEDKDALSFKQKFDELVL